MNVYASCPVFIAIFFFDLGCMLVNWDRLLILGHIVGGPAKHCIDQYMVFFYYCSLGGNTAMPGRLHARLCHAILVEIDFDTKFTVCRPTEEYSRYICSEFRFI